MVSRTWARLCRVFGLNRPRQRTEKLRGNWGINTEHLEIRALLSAAGGIAGDSQINADSIAKEAFTPPDVNNSTWTISGDVSGTVQFAQKKSRITIQVDALGLEVHAKGHFTRAHPLELNSTVRAPNTVTGHGKVTVKVHVTFENAAVPNTFAGTVTIKSQHLNLNVTGDRQV